MENTDKNIFSKDNIGFIDTNCTIVHDGKSYSAGGSNIWLNTTKNRYEGFLYYKKNNLLTNWHGNIEIPYIKGFSWKNNFEDERQAVYFKYHGKYFSGICYNLLYCRVKEIKEKSFYRRINELKRYGLSSTNAQILESYLKENQQ